MDFHTAHKYLALQVVFQGGSVEAMDPLNNHTRYMLPGGVALVDLRVHPDVGLTAQLKHQNDRRPISHDMAIDDTEKFASFMHNVDACIHDRYSKTLVEVTDFLHEILVSNDTRVNQAVSRVIHRLPDYFVRIGPTVFPDDGFRPMNGDVRFLVQSSERSEVTSLAEATGH